VLLFGFVVGFGFLFYVGILTGIWVVVMIAIRSLRGTATPGSE